MFSIRETFASAKLRGFTVNQDVQWFSGPRNLSWFLKFWVCMFLSVAIPICVGVEMWHASASNYLGTGSLPSRHTNVGLCVAPWAGPREGRGEGCDITCVVLGCHALNSSDLAVPTGVCLSMHRHSRRPLHLPQQCCWSHVTRARFGAAHFFLLGLHCTHPRIIYSTQLQVRFRESVDLAFGVRPLWILVWCVQCVTARRVCIFSLFRVNLCTWRCGLTICENVALEVAFSFVSYLFFCFRLLCACLKGVLLCHYLLFCEIAMCRGKMCYSFGLVCIYWQRGFVLRAVLYPAVVQPYRLNNVCCCWIACTFLAFCHHCVAVCVMF